MENQYKLRLDKIEEVLDSWLPRAPDLLWTQKIFKIPAANGAGAIHQELVKSLSDPARDLLDRGGKRWRPLLMLLAAEALAGEQGAKAALPLVPLVEFCHNASLIHDDIEDSSDKRRGKPAIHLIYGTDTAINSGSFLYFLPLACLEAGVSEFSAETKCDIRETWGLYMRKLHLGQAMDITWHRDFYSLPEIPEYEEMCRNKTGCLAGMAAALAVNCVRDCPDAGRRDLSDNVAGKLEEGAEKLGVGFQILDDVRNLCAGVPGKKRGDDIVEGKKSLPVLLYLHKFPEKREFTASCFHAARSAGTEAPEIEELIQAMQKTGVVEEARNRGAQLIGESREIFGRIPFVDAEAGSLLQGLVDFITDV